MRDVGNEITTNRFEPAQFGDVAQYHQPEAILAVLHDLGGGQQGAPVEAMFDRAFRLVFPAQGDLENGGQFMIATDLDERLANGGGFGGSQHEFGSRVHLEHLANIVRDHHTVRQLGEDRLQTQASFADGGLGLLQFLRHAVERVADLGDLPDIRRRHPGRQVTGGQGVGVLAQILEWANHTTGQPPGNGHDEDEGNQSGDGDGGPDVLEGRGNRIHG